MIDLIFVRWLIFIGDLRIAGAVARYTNKFVRFGGDRFNIVHFWYCIFIILQYGTFGLQHIKCLHGTQIKGRTMRKKRWLWIEMFLHSNSIRAKTKQGTKAENFHQLNVRIKRPMHALSTEILMNRKYCVRLELKYYWTYAMKYSLPCKVPLKSMFTSHFFTRIYEFGFFKSKWTDRTSAEEK